MEFEKNSCEKVLFQVLPVAGKPVVFRDLERLFETIYDKSAKKMLIESFSILFSLNLADYTIRKGYEGINNSVVISIKEEDLE